MTTYKLLKFEEKECVVLRDEKDSIPFDSANSDYANFLKDLANGVELLDAEGNVIDGKAYLESL